MVESDAARILPHASGAKHGWHDQSTCVASRFLWCYYGPPIKYGCIWLDRVVAMVTSRDEESWRVHAIGPNDSTQCIYALVGTADEAKLDAEGALHRLGWLLPAPQLSGPVPSCAELAAVSAS